MDYYSQGRPQVPAPQVNQHYMNLSPAVPTSYYGQQMQPQPQTSPYQQQHYAVSADPVNSAIDYNTQHGHSMNSHNQTSNNRARSVRSSGMMASGGDSNHRQQGQPQQAHFATTAIPGYPMPQDFPVRIVVDHKHVGAIIGNKGTHIKEIITETKARIMVDPNKVVKDFHGNADKIITIVGSLENAGKAVIKILEICTAELEKDETKEHKDVELKIRAHNQLVGRLIGKLGITIKKIMQETGTIISVSNPNEASPRMPDVATNSMLSNFPEMLNQVERTISVKGPNIECVAAAEQKISAKLRQSFEMDLHNRLHLQMAAAGGVGVPFMSPIAGEAWGMPVARPQTNFNTQIPKIIKLYVPNNMVGAIIGAKGLNIRNIIRNSGALIRIEGGEKRERSDEEHKPEGSSNHQQQQQPQEYSIHSEVEEAGQGDGPTSASVAGGTTTAIAVATSALSGGSDMEGRENERLVTITGNDMQQFRAQYLIYQRIAEQMGVFLEDVKLRTEVVVPSRLVGRIIGRGGQNVRELQRITGTTVKIPEDEPKVETIDETSKDGAPIEGTIVRIIGTIQGASSVQARIGQLIHELRASRPATIHDRRRDDHNDTHSHKPAAGGSPSSTSAE